MNYDAQDLHSELDPTEHPGSKSAYRSAHADSRHSDSLAGSNSQASSRRTTTGKKSPKTQQKALQPEIISAEDMPQEAISQESLFAEPIRASAQFSQQHSQHPSPPPNIPTETAAPVESGLFINQQEVYPAQYASTSLQKAKRKLNKSNVSRDEMNLAEFPLAVLSTRVDSKIKTLEFTDYTRGPKGEMVERQWIITGADKFGLPTATDDDVVLGLIRLTMDQDFRQPKVYFTRYELLKTLRWSTEGRSYQRLIKSLDRLSGVRVRSSNSFYDNISKSYQTSNFGIIDAYEINDERAGGEKNSFFIWSEMLFDSFKSGYIKKLDLDLYFSLKSAVARRLYRYLDKHFYFKNTLDAHLYTLAFEKIGLSRSYKYVSSIRQQLSPALTELVKIGFLSSWEILGKGQNSIIRFIAVNGTTSARSIRHNNEDYKQDSAQNTNQNSSEDDFPTSATNKKISGALHIRKQDQTNNNQQSFSQQNFSQQNYSQSSPENNFANTSISNSAISNNVTDLVLKAEITTLLVERGIMERQTGKLLSSQSSESLKKIRKIIDYYDELRSTSDKRVSINPIGFLYRAVESPYKITLPEERKNAQKQTIDQAQTATPAPASKRPEHRIFRAEPRPKAAKRTNTQSRGDQQTSYQTASNQIPASDPRRTQYRAWVDNELTCIMTRMAPVEIGELFAETENKMKSLKRILNADRFQEAVEGCVRDELKRRFQLPSFEGWVEKKK